MDGKFFSAMVRTSTALHAAAQSYWAGRGQPTRAEEMRGTEACACSMVQGSKGLDVTLGSSKPDETMMLMLYAKAVADGVSVTLKIGDAGTPANPVAKGNPVMDTIAEMMREDA